MAAPKALRLPGLQRASAFAVSASALALVPAPTTEAAGRKADTISWVSRGATHGFGEIALFYSIFTQPCNWGCSPMRHRITGIKNVLLHSESSPLLILAHSQKVHFESFSLWKIHLLPGASLTPAYNPEQVSPLLQDCLNPWVGPTCTQSREPATPLTRQSVCLVGKVLTTTPWVERGQEADPVHLRDWKLG